MKLRLFPALAFVWLLAFFPATALAGAQIEIGEEASIDLGFRLQTQYYASEKDLDGDGEFERFDDFKVRRARLRLGADVTRWVSIFLQTEFAEGDGTGGDVRLIDAFVTLKPHPLAHLVVGENMAPAMRQNLTSSGALLAVDRPGIVYKNLTWGTRARYAFTNTNYDDSDAGLRGDVDVRDTGATLFGSGSATDRLHFKYYLGVYDGIQEADEDGSRLTGRVQINLFDPEPGYYNLSTYLGEKRTIGFGAAYDTQQDVARNLATGETADYAFWTVDLFAEQPAGAGSVTLEGAWADLDLDDAAALDAAGDGVPAGAFDARRAQGNGWYVQGGYLLGNWQPWLLYEAWNSDADDDRGSYATWRAGLSYFIKGHNANLKVAYEVFDAEEDLAGTTEDRVQTALAGLYVTY